MVTGKNTDINELSEKAMLGLQKVLRKPVETSAAEDRSLVIKVNSEIKKVPAKELLHSLRYSSCTIYFIFLPLQAFQKKKHAVVGVFLFATNTK